MTGIGLCRPEINGRIFFVVGEKTKENYLKDLRKKGGEKLTGDGKEKGRRPKSEPKAVSKSCTGK